jgi:predicted flap endonuclease-1-like 5' DNA nuclease
MMTEDNDLKMLPGVGPATANKLKASGYTTAEALAVTPPKEIA